MVVRAAAALVLLATPAPAAEPVSEPASYRMEHYRAPVPATLAGASVVSTEQAAAMWREEAAVFIDVLPRPPKPDLPEGMLWREPPHFDIPGSIWLADVGFGTLAPEMTDFYRDSLERLTQGEKSRRLVIYCGAECWMSWNAAKRAVEWGYSGVHWYPDGIEGWQASGLPLEERTPQPRPDLFGDQ